MSRDPRFDVLRAVCVLSMTIGHLLSGTWIDAASHPFVFVDGAAGFVACSAVVLGIVQRRIHDRSSALAAHRSLLRRLGVLYGAHVALVIAAVLARSWTGQPAFIPSISDLGGVPDTIALTLVLRVEPPFLNVLPLYVFLFALAHVVVALLRHRAAVLAALISVAFYWRNRNGGGFDGPDRLFAAEAIFSWGQWQVLFVLGMITGWYWRGVQRVATSRAAGWLVAAAAAVALGFAVWSQAWRLGKAPFFVVLYWMEKYTFQPGMLPYTAAVAITAYWLVGVLLRRGGGPVLRALETIGCRPLFAYLVLIVTELVARTFVEDISTQLGVALAIGVLVVGWLGGAAKQRRIRAIDDGPAPQEAELAVAAAT